MYAVQIIPLLDSDFKTAAVDIADSDNSRVAKIPSPSVSSGGGGGEGIGMVWTSSSEKSLSLLLLS